MVGFLDEPVLRGLEETGGRYLGKVEEEVLLRAPYIFVVFITLILFIILVAVYLVLTSRKKLIVELCSACLYMRTSYTMYLANWRKDVYRTAISE